MMNVNDIARVRHPLVQLAEPAGDVATTDTDSGI